MGSTRLSDFNNSWYKPGRNALTRTAWYLANTILLKSSIPGSFWRTALLKFYGANIGKRVVIKPFVNIKYPWLLTIGDYSWIGEGVWIDNLTNVSIGSNCCLSQGAFLLCGNHNYKKETFDLMVEPIVLHDGVWIGAKSTVCPGVTCHSHSILGVGSIAAGNLEANTIYQGNPAIKIRERVIGS